jgi:uncharacterized delta-60 repeat protein
VKHILIILISILLLSFPLFGQSERPETIIVPVSSLGGVDGVRKQILQNTLTDELKKYFRIVPQEKYEQVLEQVFEELEFEECTEDQCIMRVQEMLQVENVFNLQVLGENKDTQLNLTWRTLDEKKNETDVCLGCGTFQLNDKIRRLIEKLVGGWKVEPVVERPVVEVKKVEKENKFVKKQWTKQLGTSSNDYGNGVSTDSSGNIYVTGSTSGGLDGNTHFGDRDIVLVKYNPSGTKQWTKQLGTSSDEWGNGVTTDSSGNVYVTGMTDGGLDGNTHFGDRDIVLIKFNSSGTKQWTKQLGTSYWDSGESVTTDSSGNIYVTGYIEGGLDGNTNSGGKDIFLVKYNSSGTKQWTKQLGTSLDDWGQDITTDSSGNIYVTGGTMGGLDGNTHFGDRDIFIIKYNSSGQKQWTKQLGTSSWDSGTRVTTDSSGNIYFTGLTSGGLDGNTSSGSLDIFLVKYNSSGSKQWTKQRGTSYVDYGRGVTTDSSGNIYVTGETLGGLDGNTNSGFEDIFLVKYNSSGTKQWTKQLGTSKDDRGFGVTIDSSGNIYVSGSTSGELDGNTHFGDRDIFLVKYSSSGTKQ